MGLASTVFDAVPPAVRYRLVAAQYRLVDAELRRLREFVPREGIALDIGAWWGPWTYWLSRIAPAVHTFEPVPHIAAFLRSVAAPNVTIHNVALSDTSGSATLHVPGGGHGTEGRATLQAPSFAGAQQIDVPTTALDDISLPGPVGFIKIDVEGHEMQVLDGARGVITRDKPVLLIEVESHDDRQTRVDEVVAAMSGLGYQASFLLDGRWRPFSEFDIDRDQRRLADVVRRRGLITNTLLTRGYVNNFLFRHGNSGS